MHTHIGSACVHPPTCATVKDTCRQACCTASNFFLFQNYTSQQHHHSVCIQAGMLITTEFGLVYNQCSTIKFIMIAKMRWALIEVISLESEFITTKLVLPCCVIIFPKRLFQTCCQNNSQSASLLPLTISRTNAFSYACFSNEEKQQQQQYFLQPIKKESTF